jgi:hypothetical protein
MHITLSGKTGCDRLRRPHSDAACATGLKEIVNIRRPTGVELNGQLFAPWQRELEMTCAATDVL